MGTSIQTNIENILEQWCKPTHTWDVVGERFEHRRKVNAVTAPAAVELDDPRVFFAK